MPPSTPSPTLLFLSKSASRDATFEFVLTDTDLSTQSVHSLTTVDGHATKYIEILAGHGYQIAETGMPDDFALIESGCSGDGTVSGTSFTADEDGTVTCHFRNSYTEPTALLSVAKSASRDATFEFVLTDTDLSTQSVHSLTTVDGHATKYIEILAGHGYQIAETGMPDDFALIESGCSGDGTVSGTSFTADEDGTVTCHFWNSYTEPTALLNVTKSADRDATFEFVLTDTDLSTQSVHSLTTVDGHATKYIEILAGHGYQIAETGMPDDFALIESGCNGNGTVSGTNFTAHEGAEIFCFFINNSSKLEIYRQHEYIPPPYQRDPWNGGTPYSYEVDKTIQ